MTSDDNYKPLCESLEPMLREYLGTTLTEETARLSEKFTKQRQVNDLVKKLFTAAEDWRDKLRIKHMSAFTSEMQSAYDSLLAAEIRLVIAIDKWREVQK